MDSPVEVLFASLPSPIEMHSACSDNPAILERANNAVLKFVADSTHHTSKDRDAGHLLFWATLVSEGKRPASSFLRFLSRYAMFKTSFRGSERKQHHLEYYRWVARGRRSIDSPFQGEYEPDLASCTQLPMSNTYVSAFTDPECDHCGKKGVVLQQCGGCLVRTPGGATFFATYYCNKECQAGSYDKHHKICQDWLKIRRATTLFQGLLTPYLSTANDRLLVGCTEIDGTAIVKYDTHDHMAFTGRHILQPFDAFRADDRELAAAALMDGQGKHVLERNRCLFEFVFRVLFPCQSVDEVTFDPKNIQRPVYSHIFAGITTRHWKSVNSLYPHTVFLITMDSGLQVIYDPTCHQFGWRDFLTPFHLYKSVRMHHVRKIVRVEQVAQDYQLRKMFGDPQFPKEPTWEPRDSVDFLKDALASHLYATISRLFFPEQGEIVNIARLVDVEDEDYSEVCERLMNVAINCLDDANEGYRAFPSFKSFYDPTFRQGVTRSHEEYDRMSRIWFTNDEYVAIYQDRRKLMNAWIIRFRRLLHYMKWIESPMSLSEKAERLEQEAARRCAESRIRSAREEQMRDEDNESVEEICSQIEKLMGEIEEIEKLEELQKFEPF